MNRRPIVGILHTLGASGAQVLDDTAAEQWGICDLKTDDPANYLHEPIPYGKTLKVESFASQAEVQQIVVIGGENKETIAANTRYKLEIHNPEDQYESQAQSPAIHAYSTGATIPAADAARTLVYSALVDKVNAYSGNNATALLLFEKAYTAGGLTGLETPIVGETAVETTSAATARIISWTITGGTFGGGDAAGTVWMALVSGTLSAVTKTWTYGSSSSTLSGTDAALLGQGIAIEDNAGYFTSKLGRPGINYVALTQGFTTDVAVVGLAGAYAMGIGSVMAALKPVYDDSKQDAITGDLAYEFTRGDVANIAKTYTKIVITKRGGDEDAIDGRNVALDNQITIYADESNGTYLAALISAIGVAAAK
jgi:hypothetical protein